MTIVKFVLAAYVFLGLFYTCFLAYASIQNVGWSKVPLFGKVCLGWIGVAFLMMDVLFNVTFGSLIYWQLPTVKTLTLSKRSAANIAGPDGWRKTLATSFVDHFLLPFTKAY